MAGRKFYVVSNLKDASTCKVERFDDIRTALSFYQTLENNATTMPALGIEAGNGAMDLIQGLNGENVLCRDYRSPNLSEGIKNVLNEVNNIVDMFVENGVVRYEYFSLPLVDSARVIAPVSTNRDDFEDGYCMNKTLKSAYRHGADAIDSVFVDGHGWVVYSDLRTNPEDYCKDGVLKVDAMNVVYVREKKLVGIDGRMDVSPADFARMVNDINKPYTLVVYDRLNYNFQYKGQHNFIVGSYDNVADAVKAWYDVKALRSDCLAYVNHYDNGRESAVFNGVGYDFEQITYEEAAEMYGFEDERTVDHILRGATKTSQELKSQNGANGRALDSFDIEKN